MFGMVTRQNVCQPLARARARLLLGAALRLHKRDQLARDERNGHKNCRQHNPRTAKMILML